MRVRMIVRRFCVSWVSLATREPHHKDSSDIIAHTISLSNLLACVRLLEPPSSDRIIYPFADRNQTWKPPLLLCAPGVTNDTFCGQDFLRSKTKSGEIKVTTNPYAAVIASIKSSINTDFFLFFLQDFARVRR